MKNVLIRSVSGAVYVAVMVSAILCGGAWLAVVLCILTALGFYEFISITKENKFPRVAATLDITAGVMMILFSCSLFSGRFESAWTFLILFLCFLVSRLICQLYAQHGNAVNALARSLMCQIYIAVPLAMIPFLSYLFSSPHIVLAILIFIWCNDTGAFCTGSLIGKHKLFERISPKKTWEGFFGGIFFAVAAAFVMRGIYPQYFNDPVLDNLSFSLLAVVVCIFATFGDLLESQIKRTAGVKDSGRIIPGHGGILDRIDSILLVMPASIIYFMMLLPTF